MIYYNSNKISDWNLGDDNIIKVYKGVKGAPPTPRLPQGYTEVEYIENTTLAYIDTGFKPNQDTRIQLSTQCVTSTPYGQQTGAGSWKVVNGIRFNYETGAQGTLHVKWGTANTWSIYSSVKGDYNVHEYDWNKNEFYRDGVLVGSSTYGNFQCTDNLGIFYCIEYGQTLGNDFTFKGKLFYFKLYDNGTLIRDFVPCTRNSDSVAGLYDMVNNTFYGSANSGYSFVAGDVVTPTSSGYTGVVCYYKIVTSGGTTSQTPCYAVVDDISQYSGTEFEDVFNNADGKWYKLNNLGQYEEYGIYGIGRTITTYEGKLTVDDGYEYIYSGGSWVNVGEVSGSTAQLPNVPFSVNYNAKSYNESTKTLLKTSVQLVDVDAVITAGTPTVHDGYISVAKNTRATITGYQNYFNRTNADPNITIVSKLKTNYDNCHIFANRGSNYNWMYRPTSGKLNFHGSSQIAGTNVTTQPVIESIRVDSNRLLTFNNYTDNTTTSVSNFSYGSTNSQGTALFAGYYNSGSEWFEGDFYWIYMSQSTLTDEQIQQVINYNEGGGGQTFYPLYYDEKQDPPQSVSFSSMTEAEEYECPYVGLDADIDGTDYIFNENYNWVTKYGLFEVSGYVCDSGDKYQKMEEKVRNVDDTWSSQDPPVYEKGELIESASTDCGGCRLPSGYTEIEYIENTSTAYINLGVKLNQTLGTSYSISTKIYSEYLSSGFGYLIGDEGTSSPYNGMCLRWNAGRLECVFVPTTDGTYVNVPNSDGTSAITISSEGVTQTNNVDLSLFCGIWSSGPWRNGKGRIYTFSLTMNNELVRDLVPAKRDSDNVVGLYDIVNDTFYTSPNGVSFVGGAVVPCRRYDAEIEYLESSGSQYINTGVYLDTSNFEIGYEIVGEKQLYGYCHQGMTNGTWLGAEQGAHVFFGKNSLGVTITSYLTSGDNTVVFTQSGVTVNGNSISKSLSMGSDNISNIPLLIYARYDFKINDIEYRTDSYSKFKSFYVKNNGTLVLDLIPVRVGQVGYMYDRVSQQLFGNDGSGSFILGLDKIS